MDEVMADLRFFQVTQKTPYSHTHTRHKPQATCGSESKSGEEGGTGGGRGRESEKERQNDRQTEKECETEKRMIEEGEKE